MESKVGAQVFLARGVGFWNVLVDAGSRPHTTVKLQAHQISQVAALSDDGTIPEGWPDQARVIWI